jgi:hypothetical protein
MRTAAVAHLISDLIEISLPVFEQFFYLFNFLLNNEFFNGDNLIVRK